MAFQFWKKKRETVSPEIAPRVDNVPVAEVESAVELEPVSLPKRNSARGIKAIFSRIKFDLENLDNLEESLIQADFGIDAAAEIVANVKQVAKSKALRTEEELRSCLRDVLATEFESTEKELNLSSGQSPYVILVIGINGVGKTTTIGKLANWLTQGGFKVMIGAADTFRAAAVEQLATWSARAGAGLVKPKSDGQDPAAVAFETIELAKAEAADVVIIDTAGRLHNKTDLMAELDKIRRVIEKQVEISEVLLVIDATTGQNGLAQAKAFTEIANVTGVVLTKLDGSAKGGIAYSIQKKLGLPVKLVGIGEGIEDFAFFDAKEFAAGLVG